MEEGGGEVCGPGRRGEVKEDGGVRVPLVHQNLVVHYGLAAGGGGGGGGGEGGGGERLINGLLTSSVAFEEATDGVSHIHTHRETLKHIDAVTPISGGKCVPRTGRAGSCVHRRGLYRRV